MPTTTGYSRSASGQYTGDAGLTTVASAGTTVLPDEPLVKISGTTTITLLTGHAAGKRITLLFLAGVTLTNAATLKLAGAVNFVATADDAITLVSDGTTWWETGRSVN